MHKILVIRLYFPLDALHVSDCVSPSSGATFYKLYIAFGICRFMSVPYVWLLCGCTGIYQKRYTARILCNWLVYVHIIE